jgi:tetratricopeptide (TPR) repeat protein
MNLGVARSQLGDLEGAIASYREAIRLRPDFAMAHCNLGQALRRTGKLQEALMSLRRGHALGSRSQRWRVPSFLWVQRCETLLRLSADLEPYLRGEAEPSAEDWIPLGEICSLQGHFREAVRFYEAGGDTFHAALESARLALADGGGDFDEAIRPQLREEALKRLTAELGVLRRLMESSQPMRGRQARLSLWNLKTHKALDGLRDREGLETLPEAERESWRAFWAKVDDLLETL